MLSPIKRNVRYTCRGGSPGSKDDVELGTVGSTVIKDYKCFMAPCVAYYVACMLKGTFHIVTSENRRNSGREGPPFALL